MKDSVLLALADRWDRDAREGSEEMREGDDIGNANACGYREAKGQCADALRTLVSMMGDGGEG